MGFLVEALAHRDADAGRAATGRSYLAPYACRGSRRRDLARPVRALLGSGDTSDNGLRVGPNVSSTTASSPVISLPACRPAPGITSGCPDSHLQWASERPVS